MTASMYMMKYYISLFGPKIEAVEVIPLLKSDIYI